MGTRRGRVECFVSSSAQESVGIVGHDGFEERIVVYGAEDMEEGESLIGRWILGRNVMVDGDCILDSVVYRGLRKPGCEDEGIGEFGTILLGINLITRIPDIRRRRGRTPS